ncbi:MAG: secondary thiamine-phosphate synthase [Gammaproteobacteria bacterium RIFCSPLOWO2_12_47_11]|jgi:secondary thiamine-phosphate synthase enzyme|nr:MAG: secondary thiamine-phosphate synthase [Gammaproteobacteria bacterium RIFCSPLOWO2_12_47_11]OGT84685.1 MAG: secondary thiamine-phosphate synthase [Gammaproteobacteria bacterium RIFCSPLOWO2_12_FULL_47_76]
MIYQETVSIITPGRGTTDITPLLVRQLKQSGITTGICNIFIQHTSASLILCENADPAVRVDLETFMSSLVKDGDPAFRHDTEGADDMPAHIRSILTDSSLTVPVSQGRFMLGTWQGIYLYEHRHSGFNRRVLITLYGE